MERGNSPDLADVVTRRDYLFGVGSIAVVSGTTGCLGVGNDNQQTGESENETNDNDSEVESTEDDALRSSDREKDDEGKMTDPDSEDETSDADRENGTTDESHDNDTTEDPPDQDDSGDETDENESEDGAGEDDSENDQEDEDSNGEEGNEGDRFEQYRIEGLSYQVDYPADWMVDEGDNYVKIYNDDETAWLWIEIREVRLDLDREVRHFREDFEPDPSVEIHADDPVTLSSGEEGHRFIIEMTERERNIFAHELIAQASGYQYRTAVVVSRSVYNEEYAQLAEEILATVALR